MTTLKGNLEGIIPAVLTPLKSDGAPDSGKLAAHCRWLLARGADALGIFGTTGEANSFTVAERVRVIEDLAATGIAGSRLMPGTGACAADDAAELTRAALRAGAAGVLMLPAFYYKNPSDEGMAAFFAEVIEKVGDARLKVYLYHFPQMAGVPVAFGVIERLLKAYPETVVGMKDSSGEFENMRRAAREFPGFAVFPGADHLLYPMLKEGGAGAITACANIVSQLSAEIYRGFRAGRDMTAAHEKLSAARAAMSKFPYPPGLKAVMAAITGDESWAKVRPPLKALAAAERAEMLKAIEGVGFALPKAA
ncbi:MAG: dihydrodipicolinate synthase family protein [Rhodospirillales bacterium]|nr:dihydrodipicolinate synthase family protein [Rhodospirillales bacterium]